MCKEKYIDEQTYRDLEKEIVPDDFDPISKEEIEEEIYIDEISIKDYFQRHDEEFIKAFEDYFCVIEPEMKRIQLTPKKMKEEANKLHIYALKV